jgi:protein-L-isoaspartate(D-aspartate) O-methyltransferase
MTYHTLAHQNLISNQLMPVNIHEPDLLQAFALTPRHPFVPEHFNSAAYNDAHLSITPSRYLLSASSFAKMLQALHIKPTDTVLDVGCLYGYSSAVISHLAKKVIAVECDESFTAPAHRLLDKHHIHNVVIVHNDLYLGYSDNAPYQAIILNGAVDKIPTHLFNQLDEGGRLVAIIWDGTIGHATLCEKHHNSFSTRILFETRLPLLPHC